MAGKADIRAGGAFVELFTKNGPLVKGLQSASRTLTSWGRSVATLGTGISAIGAGIVAPLAAAVTHFTAAGSELADLSARTGQSVGSLAELKFAAEQTGASLADIEIAIRNQQRVGIAETFDQVAARIAAIQDPAERTRAAIEAWGKSGTKLLPMVENLAALRAEARELGLVPTESAVAMADEIGDEFDKVKAVGMAAFFEIGAAVAPLLLPALTAIRNIGATVIKWVRGNGELVRTIALVGGGLVAAGAVITAIGAGLAAAGLVLGGIATAITTIGSILAFLVTPVGLIVAAVVALAATLAAVVARTAAMKTAFGGVVDALKAGNLELAWKIVVTTMRLLWAEFINFAVGKFLDLVQLVADNPLTAWLEIADDVNELIDSARAGPAKSAADLRAELAALRKKAADEAAKAAREKPVGGGIIGPDDELGTEIKAPKTARPVLTAGTTHAALALSSGFSKPSRDEEKQLLREIRGLLKAGLNEDAALLRDLLREMRRGRVARFGP